jgi:hypothetical protein
LSHYVNNRPQSQEGVESPSQAEFARDRACDAIQGFYVSRPAAAAEFSELLRHLCQQPCGITARWLNRDPNGEAGGSNFYAYTGEDPSN